MSNRPTPATLDDIRRPYNHSAFRDRLIKGLTTHNAVPTDADRQRMFDMIGERILGVEPTLKYVKKSIPIKSFSVKVDDLVHGKKKMELSFWLPINKGYSIHVNIDVNSLNEEDTKKMEEVNFRDYSGNICSLYELYCYANGIPMSGDMLKNFITCLSDKSESMLCALKWAFNHGTLVLTSNGNQNFLDIIQKAGRLYDKYADVQIPHILRTLSRSGLQLSNHGNGGGRGRQRRRRISLLSRKKRNTRMKKSKKYNKSKKIKK